MKLRADFAGFFVSAALAAIAGVSINLFPDIGIIIAFIYTSALLIILDFFEKQCKSIISKFISLFGSLYVASTIFGMISLQTFSQPYPIFYTLALGVFISFITFIAMAIIANFFPRFWTRFEKITA